MKTRIVLFMLLLGCTLCNAQTINGTFQGEIEGVSPLIIHLKGKDGIVEGFYKYPSDSVVIPLKGILDSTGNLSLGGTQKAYPVFWGKLEGKLIKGDFIVSKRAEPNAFYAFNFRGEYDNSLYGNYFSITLSDKGYMIKDETRSGKQELITTYSHENGKIYIQSDSLNARFYLNGDTLVADTTNGLPLFMPPYVKYKDKDFFFIPIEGFLAGSSFVEFPEQDEEWDPEGRLYELNDTISLRLAQISKSEYVIRKWVMPASRPYKVITDFAQAEKKLRKKLQFIEGHNVEGEEWRPSRVRITFNDGIERELNYGGVCMEDYFVEYYPELDVVIFVNEAGGEEVIDLNDSSPEYKKRGNPAYHVISPDGRWRITGYYPGGAIDGEEWWLEMLNPSLKKYEYFPNYNLYKTEDGRYGSYMPHYMTGWFWINNTTLLFRNQNYYKLEIVIKHNEK